MASMAPKDRKSLRMSFSVQNTDRSPRKSVVDSSICEQGIRLAQVGLSVSSVKGKDSTSDDDDGG